MAVHLAPVCLLLLIFCYCLTLILSFWCIYKRCIIKIWKLKCMFRSKWRSGRHFFFYLWSSPIMDFCGFKSKHILDTSWSFSWSSCMSSGLAWTCFYRSVPSVHKSSFSTPPLVCIQKEGPVAIESVCVGWFLRGCGVPAVSLLSVKKRGLYRGSGACHRPKCKNHTAPSYIVLTQWDESTLSLKLFV